MEEKDRYELQEVFEDDSFHWCLKDNDTKLLKPLVSLHNCVDLLNQQNKRIKELEKNHIESVRELVFVLERLNSQPIEICQKLIDMLTDRANLIDFGNCAEFMFTVYDLEESIKEILEQYKKYKEKK